MLAYFRKYKNMNVLVLGSGAREHAICSSLKKSKNIKNLWCMPGNAGTRSISKYKDINPNNNENIITFCKENKVDLVIPGSEVYLANGVADDLALSGIAVFGPSEKASKLETSKIFTKKICSLSDISTAKYKIYQN